MCVRFSSLCIKARIFASTLLATIFDVQGKDLYMDLDESNLTLSDPTDFSILNVQPIQSIRVWGVGRDNGRCVHVSCVQCCHHT